MLYQIIAFIVVEEKLFGFLYLLPAFVEIILCKQINF